MLTKRGNVFPFFLTLFFIAFSFSVFSQTEKQDFSKIDAYAKSIKGISDISKLSKKLTTPYATDLEKIRSVFRWVTENIAYDTKEYHLDSSQSNYSKLFYKLDPQAKNIYNLYDQEIARYVLKNKKGICAGYAALFKALCDSSGLKCEIVTGIIKNSVDQVGTATEKSHAWNAVQINDKWQLLDATWSSGFCDSKVTKFTKRFSEAYFLTPPEKLVLNHYPTNKKWFLLPSPPAKTQFLSYPLIYDAYFENGVSSFSPINGVIEAKIGNKVSFELRIPEYDSEIAVQTKTGNNNVKIKKQEKTISYEYTISSDKDDELTIYINNTAICAYRIVVVP